MCLTILFQGDDVIVILPWEEWWEDILTHDDSDSHIALLPMHPDIRAKFNETAAWEYARSMEGKPYGYHNMIFSWIDTLDENYPPPLDAHVVLLSLSSNISFSGYICDTGGSMFLFFYLCIFQNFNCCDSGLWL